MFLSPRFPDVFMQCREAACANKIEGESGDEHEQLIMKGRTAKLQETFSVFADSAEGIDEQFTATSQKREPTSISTCCKGTREYDIVLSAAEDGRFGAKLTLVPEGMLVWRVRSPGSISRWNAEHPDAAVQAGDIIIQIDGVHATADMMSDIKPHQLLKLRLRRSSYFFMEQHTCTQPFDISTGGSGRMTIQKLTHSRSDNLALTARSWGPEEVQLVLNNPQGLPLGAQIVHQKRGFAIVQLYDTGLLGMWNWEHPHMQITIGDVIVEVNDTRDPVHMISYIHSARDLKIVIQKRPNNKLSHGDLYLDSLSRTQMLSVSADTRDVFRERNSMEHIESAPVDMEMSSEFEIICTNASLLSGADCIGLQRPQSSMQPVLMH